MELSVYKWYNRKSKVWPKQIGIIPCQPYFDERIPIIEFAIPTMIVEGTHHLSQSMDEPYFLKSDINPLLFSIFKII